MGGDGGCVYEFYGVLSYTFAKRKPISMSIPLLCTSSSAIFVDDDHSYLDSLSVSIGVQHRPRFFVHPAEVDEALIAQDALTRREQQLLGAISAGGDTMPISAALQYFFWPGRHQIVSVLVSDQVMPAESGVSLCARHAHFGLRRILLTGAADSHLAVKAFNSGSIDQFIPKQSYGLLDQINEALSLQMEKSMEHRDVHLRDSLPAWALKALSSTRFGAALSRFLQSRGIVEYVVLGQPFGVLGLTRNGSMLWCPIENDNTLDEVIAMICDLGWAADAVDQVSKKLFLCNVELVAQLEGVAPAIAQAVTIVQDHNIYISAFPLPVTEVALVPAYTDGWDQ